MLKVDSVVVKLKILLDDSSSASYLYYFCELKRKEYNKVDKQDLVKHKKKKNKSNRTGKIDKLYLIGNE